MLSRRFKVFCSRGHRDWVEGLHLANGLYERERGIGRKSRSEDTIYSYLIVGYTDCLRVAALHAVSVIYSSDWHITIISEINRNDGNRMGLFQGQIRKVLIDECSGCATERLYGISSSKRKAVPQRTRSSCLH